jgi:hypothetical protein
MTKMKQKEIALGASGFKVINYVSNQSKRRKYEK